MEINSLNLVIILEHLQNKMHPSYVVKFGMVIQVTSY